MKIKSLIVLCSILFSVNFYSAQSYAQSDTKQGKSPEEIAAKISDKMKSSLSLTDEQYKQVYDLVYSRAQSRISNNEQYKSLDKESRKQMMKQNRDEFRKQLESILTQDQMLQLNQLKEKHKQKSKEGIKNKQ